MNRSASSKESPRGCVFLIRHKGSGKRFVLRRFTGEHPSKKLAPGHMGRVMARFTQVNPQKRYKDVLYLMEAI